MKKATTIIGYIAAMFVIMGLIFKTLHWPGAGPLLIFGFSFFSFFFIPVYGYKMFYDFSDKKSKTTGVIGAFSLSIIVLSILFKIQHWPGAGPAMLIGNGLLALVISPMLMFIKFKSSKSSTEKIFHLFWYVSVSLILLGYIFKTFHFPLGNPLLVLGALVLCFGYLPLAIKFYNNEQFREKLYTRFLIIPLVIFVLYSLGGNISRAILNAFVLVDDAVNTTEAQLSSRNNIRYEDFNKFNSGNAKIYYLKAVKVKEFSDDLVQNIDKLKAHLIRACDRVPPEIPDDSLNLANAETKDNYDIPTHIMIGEPAAPKSGAWTGIELKAKIFVYRQDIVSMYEGGMKEIAEKTIGLKTDDFGINEYGAIETWETGYFYHVPLATVITILSKLQSDVRYAESVTVEYLYNEAEKKAAVGSGGLH